MSLALIIGFGILFMAVASLIMGVNIIRNADMPKSEREIIALLSVFAFLWCGGYGVMSLADTYEHAYIGRIIGLIGVYCFIATCMRFFIYYCGKNTRHFNLLWSLDWIWGFSCIIVLANPMLKSVLFVKTPYGTAFYPIIGWVRWYGLIYLIVNCIVDLALLIRGKRNARLKRQKRVINTLIVMLFMMVVFSVYDGFFPSRSRASFPTSCIGVFAVMIMMCVLAFRMHAFSITKGNISKYIYESIGMPVILLDERRNILLTNKRAEAFFGDSIHKKHFDDLFEITKDDAEEYISNVLSGIQEESFQLITKEQGAVCDINANAILDEFGELLCVVVFVNDMTSEYHAFQKLEGIKVSLQNELDEKTKQMEDMTLQAITTIANFIDSKEAYTIGHSTRVAKYAEAIARELGWSDEEVINIHYVGLLHDIGKIGISHTILNKTTSLTDEEYQTIKQHTIIGGEILRDIKTVEHVEEGALYHHEHYDGSGYPFGLANDDIPLIARIIGLADAYDAMTSTRKYRKPLPEDVVRREIEHGAGKQFDPYIASVMLRMLDEGLLQSIGDVKPTGVVGNILVESNMLMARVMGNEIENTRQEAENDYLTQVWNRRTGEKHICDYLRVSDGALVIIDLDNFKGINDNYGHQIGDQVLQLVSDVLRLHAKNEYLCRLGGDEFLLFIRDVKTVEEVKKTLDAINYTYNSKVRESEYLAHTSLSMGVSLSVNDGRDYMKLYRCADRALYYVKQNGKRGYSFHNKAEYGGVGNDKSTIDLTRIVNSLKSRTEYTGAYKMEYGQFLRTHEFIEKYTIRNRQCMQLVLLTIDYENSVDFSPEEKVEVMKELESTVTSSLRGVDVSTRFSNSQILLTLVDTDKANVSYVVRRILNNFYNIYRASDVKIKVESADITGKAS